MVEKMGQVKTRLSEDEIASLLLMLAFMLGIWLRLTPPGLAGFPVNDGGMFAVMISDLGDHHYSLPAFTTYNGATIPFVYPPLGLYIARILIDIFHISVFQILLWLPAFISVLTILAFYMFANELLESRIQASLATVIFAISPRSFSWFVMGGGLTRVLGMLGLLLTLYGARKLFREPSRKNLFLTILFGTLTVLSHPEAIVHTIAAAVLLWLTTARNKAAFVSALQVCVGVIILASPWWATVLFQHGPGPFMRGSQTGFPVLFFAVIPFYFTEETMMTLISVLSLIGIFTELRRQNYFLPAWIFVSFLVEPRSAAWVANISLAMLGAIALDKIILVGLSNIKNGFVSPTDNRSVYESWITRLLLGYICLYIAGGTYTYSVRLANIHLDNDQRQAMSWVKNNTPDGSHFVLLTTLDFADYPMRDPVQEWFPALTGRTSETTLQGREWLLGGQFFDSFDAFREMQNCIPKDRQCIETEAKKLGISFDYLYIKKQTAVQCQESATCRYNSQALVEDLEKSSAYTLVYENNVAVIFRSNTIK